MKLVRYKLNLAEVILFSIKNFRIYVPSFMFGIMGRVQSEGEVEVK